MFLNRRHNDICPAQPQGRHQAGAVHMDRYHTAPDCPYFAMPAEIVIDNRSNGFDRRGQITMPALQLPGQIGNETSNAFGSINPCAVPAYPI